MNTCVSNDQSVVGYVRCSTQEQGLRGADRRPDRQGAVRRGGATGMWSSRWCAASVLPVLDGIAYLGDLPEAIARALPDHDLESIVTKPPSEWRRKRPGIRRSSSDDTTSSALVPRTSFSDAVEGLAEALSVLKSVPAQRLAKHPKVPSAPGVDLFSEKGKAVYVGQSRNLRCRLTQHTSERSRENNAPFAFNLAIEAAERKKLDLPKTRKAKKPTLNLPHCSWRPSGALPRCTSSSFSLMARRSAISSNRSQLTPSGPVGTTPLRLTELRRLLLCP